MKNEKNKLYLGFSFIVIIMFLIYGFSHFLKMPHGIHQWRQSMNFSMVLNYHNNLSSFLHPTIHNLFFNDRGDILLEFPLFQWITALFPEKYYFIFRILVFLASLLGLWFTYLLSNLILKDVFWSVINVLFIVFIPIFLFYNANYMVDIPSVLFAISAIYFWHKANLIITEKKEQLKYIIVGSVFFLLSGLLRLPCIIIDLAYIASYFFFIDKKNIFFVFGSFLSLSIITGWYFYQSKINNYYVATPFKSGITIFHLNNDERKNIISIIVDFISNQWGFLFRNVIGWLVLFILILFHWANYPKWLKPLLLWTFLGSMIYFFLWFKVLDAHDYYTIPLIGLFYLLVLFSLIALKEIHNVYPFKTLLTIILILLFSFFHAYENFSLRSGISLKIGYYNVSKFEMGMWWWFNFEGETKWSSIRKISPLVSDILLKHNIKKNDTAICNFDLSPTYVLSILQLRGWSLFNNDFSDFNSYKNYASKGAKYLIHYGLKRLDSDPQKDSIIRQNLVLNMDSIFIYDIRHLKSIK